MSDLEADRQRRCALLNGNAVMDPLGYADAGSSVFGAAREFGPRAPGLTPFGGGMMGLGAAFSGLSLAQGGAQAACGNYSQAAWDLSSGALGTAGLFAGGAMLTGAGTVASLGAFGNERAQEAGLYGTDPGAAGGAPVHPGLGIGDAPATGRPLSFLESIGMRARSGYRAGNDLAGGGVGGTMLGLGAGAAAGADQVVRNSVEAAWQGTRRLFGRDAPPAPSR